MLALHQLTISWRSGFWEAVWFELPDHIGAMFGGLIVGFGRSDRLNTWLDECVKIPNHRLEV